MGWTVSVSIPIRVIASKPRLRRTQPIGTGDSSPMVKAAGASSSLQERSCTSTPPTSLYGAHRQSFNISIAYSTTLSVTQNSGIIGEYVPKMTWKGNSRSLLETPSGRDIAQHCPPVGGDTNQGACDSDIPCKSCIHFLPVLCVLHVVATVK